MVKAALVNGVSLGTLMWWVVMMLKRELAI
jgi:hypothetical protein